MAEEELKEANLSAESEAPSEATSSVGQLDTKDELARKEKQIFDLEGQLKRLAADFENFRRRQAQEREELIKFAASRVFEHLLPVVDNFERALAGSKQATDVQQVLTGVELIYRQMQDFLQKSGVAPMEAVGKPFDPNLHEAIAQFETTEAPDQTVLAEIQKGYYLNGKVVRHAMVQVASNPHGAAPTQTTESTTAAPADSDKEDNHG
ncbi:MAG TPA: nucleotide exchange factor GrpE [Stenomitos sp.]